tara:strand:- start:2255 stop:2884 length:630 start_codon:yes stop_codon:yes gene_type:complete
MALDTYANLKISIRSWSHRGDMTDALIDDFIDMAESEMYNNAVEPLRIREMESRATASLSTSDRFLALPDLFLAMRRLKLNLSGGDCDVKFQAPDQMVILGTSGIPRFYTVTSQLGFDRVSDSAYTGEMQYYKKLTALSSANTTNDILTNYPEIYLNGALSYLHRFTQDIENAEYYKTLFYTAIKGANKSARKGRYGSAPFIRTEGSTP